MIPVTQRVEGYPHGECVRASYAALFELPIELVPRFDPGALRPGESQAGRERAWLSMIGFDLVEVPPARMEDVPPAVRQNAHLMSGLSPRGLGHRCLGYAGELLWDPHPSRAGLVRLDSLGFLLPHMTERSA